LYPADKQSDSCRAPRHTTLNTPEAFDDYNKPPKRPPRKKEAAAQKILVTAYCSAFAFGSCRLSAAAKHPVFGLSTGSLSL